MRKRRLPAEQVIGVVLGVAPFRDRPLKDVVSKLDHALPSDGSTVARSSIAQARKKLGSEAPRWLFELREEKWAHQSAHDHPWRGLDLRKAYVWYVERVCLLSLGWSLPLQGSVGLACDPVPTVRRDNPLRRRCSLISLANLSKANGETGCLEFMRSSRSSRDVIVLSSSGSSYPSGYRHQLI
jgi:hypothetical protein